MKRRWGLFPFLLFFLLQVAASRVQLGGNTVFEFTAPVYNVSLEENARGTQFANSIDPIRIGVALPDKDATVRFKIVEGDKQHHFKAHARQVGDFVFLRIRQKDKHDTPLNRELRDYYDFLVKATCRQKDAGNLETTARVRLTITDRNDASPMFTLESDVYKVTINDQTPPFTDVIRIEASDADEGLNGQIYFSLLNRSAEFTVDPFTGWVRTLRHVRAGIYELKAKAEDRTSRLFYYDEDQIQPAWTCLIVVNVNETKHRPLKITAEKKSIDSYISESVQLAAIVKVEEGDINTRLQLAEGGIKHLFTLMESENHEWMLYTVPGHSIPVGTNVTLIAGNENTINSNTTITTEIDVKVKHSITFDQSRISFTIGESVPIGFVVGRISAEVKLQEDKINIRYYLEALENGTVPFRLSERSGVLRVSELLDFEVQKEYKFIVLAKLKGYNEQASLIVDVFVTDCNDHSPVWAAKWSRQGPIAIPDNYMTDRILFKVDALDQDAGDNRKIGYKLSADGVIPLKIGFETGEISITSALPKSQDEWRVSVWAVDWGKPLPRSTVLNLVFYRNGTKVPVKPRPVISSDPPNKYAPVFENIVDSIDIWEDIPIETFITKIRVYDKDVGYAGLVRFATWDDYFAIDSVTGEITVADNLSNLLSPGVDSVTRQIEILASDLGSPQKSSKTTIRFIIRDVNNNSPVFDQLWYHIRLPEDLKIGEVLLKVSASDDDSAENGRVGYRLAGGLDKHIQIDERTGTITLVQKLDRESEDVLRYTVVAFDHGVLQRMSFVNLTIAIDDVNDNPPVCIEPVTIVRIPEDFPDSALVGCVAARDLDVGVNSHLRFSIDNEDHPPFRIDRHTGCIFVHSPHQPLDYENRPIYNLTVDVADNGESVLSTTCGFVIELLDIDENLYAPEFDDIAHEASVYENMPIGTEVFIVKAVDQDRNALKLRYSFVGGDGMAYFSIDLSGVIRTSHVLDREECRKYWLTVEATDDANRPRSAILHVFVRVLDKNDHRPSPLSPVYYSSVKENSPQNHVVVKLEATDGDDIGQDVQPLHFRIAKGDPQSFFRIDQNTGYIMTSGSRKLDRETLHEHELWVEVCDSGDQQLCSIVPVVVAVEDINDNAPAFLQPIHHYSVPAGVTGIIYRIFAIDIDVGANAQLYYNITDGDSRFSIDEFGSISTNQPLEYDEVFSLTIQATDRGLPAQMTQTRIILTAMTHSKRVKGIPNRQPKFVEKNTVSHRIPISDADQIGVTIGKLEAHDPDGDPLWWSIIDGNINETFYVKADSGLLVLALPVENLPHNLSEITLKVKVTDGELNDVTTVIIELSRSISSRPQFTALHYKTQISEKTSIGTQIYTIKARTENSGISVKPVIYGIYSTEDTGMDDKLRIEPSTGNVLVMESLDFEVTREIRTIVFARQGSLTSYATLTVSITDDNDNAPKFLHKDYDVRVPIKAVVGSVIVTVLAYDSDSGDNGAVRYSIVSGNEMGFFALDTFSGAMRVAKRLSDEYMESILTIRATDGGKYTLSDTSTVRIQTIINEEQNIRFTRALYQKTVKESTSVGSIILVVSTEPNGQARYSVKQPCSYFEVHPISGAVTLKRWLTHERAKSISCTIIARSKEGLEDSTKIILKTSNTNLYAPMFKQQVYNAVIRENSPIGSAVLFLDNSPALVVATDKDSGPNALIGYRILNPNEAYFSVDFVSGAIRTRRPIDYEKVKEWKFHVQASDMGHPVHSSPVPALVIISVIDENDHPPVFSKSLYRADLILPSVSGIVLLRTEAHDEDTTGKLRYYIKDKTVEKLFTVDPISGSLFLVTAEAKFLNSSKYQFDLYVSDGVHSASTRVEINIVRSSRSSVFRFPLEKYTTKVRENTTIPEGKLLMAVTAIGAPDGTAVVYSMLNTRDEFIIHSGTGMVALSGIPFDREKESTIYLLIQARTHEFVSQVAQTVISVEVEDINDCHPQFISLPYTAVVSIDAKIGDKIIGIRAVDKDSGVNGMVRYHSPSIPIIFKLNKYDGKITVGGSLIDVGPRVYEFEVEAEDQGNFTLKSVEKVRIEVMDKARPLFSEQLYRTTISESAGTGTTVITVKALSSYNNYIVYSIESGDYEENFSMNWDTGTIILKSMLDREERSEYNLIVMANDVTRDGINSTAMVNIKILGVNDNGPHFLLPVYHIHVSESMPVGAELLTVSATDPDGDGGTISYAVVGPDSTIVKVDIESGVITLMHSLDYEKKRRNDMILVASDSSQLTGEAQLILEVDDVNDEPPHFSNPFASAEIVDTAQPGQFIVIMSVTDKDTISSVPDGHRLLFSIIEGDETLFQVDRHSGEVTLSRVIEIEDLTQNKKHLNVSVSDGVFTAYGQLLVTIIVSGRRQPPPRFEQSQYAIGIRENNILSNKSFVLTVRARDGVPPLYYSIGVGHDGKAWPLKIEKETGKIHPRIVLDYHTQNMYRIPLVVEDALKRRAFSTLILNVIDENDSAPQFIVSRYTCSISASAKEGDSVIMVSAIDEDEGDLVEYTMLAVDKAAAAFRVHPRQGTIIVAGKLEGLVDSSLTFMVKATDLANPPHHSTTEVSISILSVDAAVPKFSNSHYLFLVQENLPVGTVIGKLQQTEQEVTQVRYSVFEAPPDFPLTIERSSGKLIVRQQLDREQQQMWRIAVRADAPEGAHCMTTVTVRVGDVNDNAPMFIGSYERLSISEDAPVGTSIAVFSATDKDRAPGGRITFSLLESVGSEALKMDAESGWLIVARSLNREIMPSFDLTARATDEGGLSTDIKFKLEVTDVNDEPPQFDKKEYDVSIEPDQLTSGQIISHVTVKDKDMPPFNSSRLFILAGNDDGLFKITDSGEIKVERIQFFHERQNYNLTLLSFDGMHSSTANVKIKVDPRFSGFECISDTLQIKIPEDTTVGTVIYSGNTNRLRYKLISTDDPPPPFSIDHIDGTIRLSGNIDAEIRKTFSFVRQSSSKSPSFACTQPVKVHVIDVNDESPVFMQNEYEVSIKENLKATRTERQFLTRVHAIDKDSGVFGRVRYSLFDDHGTFMIDERSGSITVIRPLDREEQDKYILNVQARDSDPTTPMSSKAVVHISVADQNDNAPIFEKTRYVLQVMETESIGYSLTTLRAEGGDRNETVAFSLAPNETSNSYVHLNPDSGVLTLTKSLDFEKEKQLSLIVIATDSGNPPLSTEAIVEIQVLDENDNPPVFARDSYKSDVRENVAKDTKVLKIRATDADSEHYGRVGFSLSGEPGPFHIDDDGWITVVGTIDREKVSSYHLIVEAHDGGAPPQTAQVELTITVTDENDNSPVFEDCNMTAVVQEGVSPGHILFSVAVSDADGPLFGGPFSLELRGEGNRAFMFEHSNIITASRLDHSKKDRFSLMVVATDKGGRSTECPLIVFVKEESRHPPRITPLRISLNTLMGEFRGGIIGTITAKDEDVDDMLRYSLVEGSIVGPLPTPISSRVHASKTHLFRVGPESGDVWAEHSISAGLHAFNVSVTDGKYATVSFVEVEVMSLEQDAVDHAVCVRLKEMTAEEFFAQYFAAFRAVFAKHLNVLPENVYILSVQNVPHRTLLFPSRGRRSPSDSDIDVLFVVSRGAGRGMLKPDHIYTRLKQDFQSIVDQSNKMKYQLTTEMCTPGVCQRGECRERVSLDDQRQTIVSIGGTAFVAPYHSRTAECLCPEGYGGIRCDVEVNSCSRSPCDPFEMCVPSDDSLMGFECLCPPGMAGERCSRPSCSTEGRCLEEAELSVGGNGYFEMSIAHEVETRMELEIEFRTISTEGVLMHARGSKDFHTLELISGKISYRWDAGSGQGIVTSEEIVADGQWHWISVSRRGRRSRLVLDRKEPNESWSPLGSDVINLHYYSQRLVFGAQVEQDNGTSIRILQGVAACFRTISVDRRSVAKTRQGLRLHNAVMGCRAMAATPCSEAPCQNGATCHVIGSTYRCSCPTRYMGAQCEVDSDPCGSRPCPLGIQCIPFYNDYLCKCPNGFTGKRCETRGYEVEDVCAAQPCGRYGTCIPIPRQHVHNLGFICNCSHGFSGKSCDDSIPSIFSRTSFSEIIVCLAVVILIGIVVIIIIVICKRLRNRSENKKYGEHINVPHMRNPHVLPSINPPPLPPRGFRGGNKLSNLEQAQLTGLPTVQVRPLPMNERLSSSGRGDSRSPSLAGSGKQWKHRVVDYGSAADSLEQSGRCPQDGKTIEALRLFGIRIPEDDDSSVSSGPSRVRPADRRKYKQALECLNQERYPLADSIQCLPTNDDDVIGNWSGAVDPIGEAVRQERLRLESLTGRVQVGDTVLSPLVNDEDYMTMRPRRTDTAGSQKRPLLHDRDGNDEVESSMKIVPPSPPAHKNHFAEGSRVYDDPAVDSESRHRADTYNDSQLTSNICDIDASESDGISLDDTV